MSGCGHSDIRNFNNENQIIYFKPNMYFNKLTADKTL